jgi:hypothetical protein
MVKILFKNPNFCTFVIFNGKIKSEEYAIDFTEGNGNACLTNKEACSLC